MTYSAIATKPLRQVLPLAAGLLLLLAALLLPASAFANLGIVSVSIADKQHSGMTFQIEQRCYALAPFRLGDYADTPIVTGRGGLRSTAKMVHYYEIDLMILELSLGSGLCTEGGLPKIEGLDDLLEKTPTATLLSRDADGRGFTTTLALRDFAAEWVTVAATEGENALTPKHAGSVLAHERQVIGMLVSVDPADGVGRVLRMDRVIERVTASLHQALSAHTPKIVGCWSIENSTLNVHADHRFTFKDFEGTWNEPSGGGYDFLHEPFVDTVRISSDSKRLSGTNNHSSQVSWERIEGPSGRLEGKWKSVFGVLEIRADGSAEQPGVRATWKEIRPGVYELRWNHRFIWNLRALGDGTYIRGKVNVGLHEDGVTTTLVTVGPLLGERSKDSKSCSQ